MRAEEYANLLAEYLWDDEQIDRIADAIASVQPPKEADDVYEWHAECACAVVELLAGPRPVRDEEPSEGELERIADRVGVPRWEQFS